MNTTSLLESLATRGILLSTEGATLYAEPSARLTDSDRAAIRAHKAALIAVVKLRAFKMETRRGKVRRVDIDYLKALHRYAEYLCGQYLTLDGKPLPMKYHTFDAGAAYRSDEGRAQRAMLDEAVAPFLANQRESIEQRRAA